MQMRLWELMGFGDLMRFRELIPWDPLSHKDPGSGKTGMGKAGMGIPEFPNFPT